MNLPGPDSGLRGADGFASRLLGRLLGGRWWIPRAVLLAWGLAVLFSVPGYERTGTDRVHELRDMYFAVVELTIDQPLSDLARTFPEHTNPAKRTFRLTVPLVARLTNTGLVGAIVLNYLCAYATLHLAALLAFRVLGDRVDAALVVFALAGTYFGTAAFKDIFGWFDPVAFVLLLLASLQRRCGWYALTLLAAFFTDERALLVAPATLVGSFVAPRAGESTARRVAPLVAALALYGVIRVSLTLLLGLATATEAIGLDTARGHLPHLGLALWSSFEGLWILAAAGLWHLLRAGRSARTLALLGATWFVLFAASCFLVIDVTRSLAYAAVGVFPLLAGLRDRVDRTRLRALLVASAVVSIVTPNLFVWDCVDYELPLLARLVLAACGGAG